ncbi:MAG: nicotinate phosphoribosyltransferase [Elusimicrobia bacterium]|nr:nicotinate phosphoribosyltransferase [Elusimicrobiota bacterium]
MKTGFLGSLYGGSLALLTDLYQLTMAYGYWKSRMADHEGVFHLHFRKNPFAGGYALSCGLQTAMEYLRDFRYDPGDLDYLAGLAGNDGKPLFERAFLDYLSRLEFACDVDAIPEGRLAFPHEPLLRLQGPIIQCQLLETPLLNIMNFSTLVATKAARIVGAAKQDPVVEFGLRRAQGVDGALTASRAAFVGGCAATSNVLAGKLLGIPVKGTHAHSWIMSFDDELSAFDAYAKAMPNNCVFLVDTYDTLEGVKKACEVGRRLKAEGRRLVGIRLDSGDLAYLSIEARRILDEAGFPDAGIFATNDLDETLIASLKEQGAQIAVWGVGTKLVTAFDQPALGGVYKLSAIRAPGGEWRHRLKLSEQAAKVSIPGILQVRRFTDDNGAAADMIYDALRPPKGTAVLVDPLDPTRRKRFPAQAPFEDLLVPVFRKGKAVYDAPPLPEVRDAARRELEGFHAGIRRLVNPHRYPVGLEEGLHELKTRLALEKRGFVEAKP